MRNKISGIFFGLALCAIILSALSSAQAQIASPSPSPIPKASPTPTLEHEFFRNVLHDQVAIWTAPFHLHQRDARWLAPIGLGTAALATLRAEPAVRSVGANSVKHKREAIPDDPLFNQQWGIKNTG